MKRIATLVAGAALLAVPAAASAESIKQEGFVVGDKAATVQLRVKVNGGEAKKIGGFRVKNVAAQCGNKEIRTQLTALTPVKVEQDDGFKVRLSDGKGGILRINGEVKNHGRATAGNLKTNDYDSGGMTCKVAKQKFKTSAG